MATRTWSDWYKENKEKRKSYNKNWWADNKDKKAQYQKNFRAKEKAKDCKFVMRNYSVNGNLNIATTNENELSLKNKIEHEKYLKEMDEKELLRKKTGGRLI